MTVMLRTVDAGRRFVGEHEYRQATIVPRLNQSGTFVATLDPEHAAGLRRGTAVVWSDEFETILSGLVTKRRRVHDPEGPEGDQVVIIQGRGDMHRLAGRLAFPDPELEADDPDQPATWDRTGPAGEVLADMVRLNAGPGALTARQIPGLEIADAAGLGTAVRARRRFPVIADEIERLGEAGGVVCELAQPADESVLRFTVREVQDVSAEVFFSAGRGNLYGFELETALPEATLAIVAGRGEGADRMIRVRERDLSIWGRVEAWIDARQVGEAEDDDQTHAADLDDEGDAALAELRARVNISADVVDLPDSPVRWRRDYQLGDLVGVLVDDDAFVAQVAEVTVEASGEAGTTITPAVGGVSPRRRLDMLERLKAVEARLAAQERS